MLAWRLHRSGEQNTLVCDTIADPKPGAGELLIRVRAAGVTPTEMVWYPTTHTKSGGERELAVTGHEFSGVVESVGADARGFKVGDEIYGMNDWFADGATAEVCVTRPDWIAPKPRTVSFAHAAAVPIGALTAWQGLFDRAKLQAGESVLIHGGSGAVGVFAVQLAHRHGARVTTTASAKHREFLIGLGAERVIDYHTERFDEVLKSIDVVFDGVGGETLQRSWNVLGPKGRMVTIAADSEGSTDERSKNAFFIVEANQQQLMTIGKRLDAGEIRVFVDAEVSFDRADRAYVPGKVERSGRGKTVVVMPSESSL